MPPAATAAASGDAACPTTAAGRGGNDVTAPLGFVRSILDAAQNNCPITAHILLYKYGLRSRAVLNCHKVHII